MEDDEHISGEDEFPEDDENAEHGHDDQYGMFDDDAVDLIDQEDGKLW